MLCCDGYTEVSERVVITVGEGEVVGFTAAVAVGDGPFITLETLTVDFTGATDDLDWIGLYNVGDVPGGIGSHDWSYHGSVSDSGSAEVTPRAAGEYFIVMLCCDGYTEVSERVVITVAENPNPPAVVYTATVALAGTTSCVDDDATAVATAASLGVTVTDCAHLVATAAPCDDATYGETVRTVCALTCNQCTYFAGTALTVDFTGATDALDWVGLYLAGQTPGDEGSHDWSYHGAVASDAGSVEVTPRDAGEYYVVMLCCDGYTEVSPRTTVTIVEDPNAAPVGFTATVSVSGDGPYNTGVGLVIAFTGATDSADWIGLYNVGDVPGDQSAHAWTYHESVSDSGAVVVTPGAAGDYYVVMLCCDGYTEVTERATVTVTDAAVVATDYPINWIITDYTTTSYTATVGDTVTFSWSGGHNVFLHPTGTCDDAGATEVSSSSPVIYTFTEAGSFTFACDVGSHCENGQILTFTVV
jgi:plastocyanin